MYFLYLDDSGSVNNSNDKYIILAGLSVFEREPYFLSNRLDELAKRIYPDNWKNLEFRGVDIFGGRKHWRGINKPNRIEIYKEALAILAQSRVVRLFGAVIHKSSISPSDPVEYAFEQICSRFDKFLLRLYRQSNTQRGLIVFDKSSYETSIQGLAKEFSTLGHSWGVLRNMADVPLFVDSKATRMIQYADMIAYALRRYYENNESDYFNIISKKFDSEGGVIHGLFHYNETNTYCGCIICSQKTTTSKQLATAEA